ncbi:hypothetical protein RRG08_013352 [Elysia crispata]|uniref:Uncharacterized protein n=1 Tax=Elysia crispata TaxID=231223 RepID=A0AAE1B077_9GAST|nr:hypothetical protein RRG08_013352 [Elysia crispata]
MVRSELLETMTIDDADYSLNHDCNLSNPSRNCALLDTGGSGEKLINFPLVESTSQLFWGLLTLTSDTFVFISARSRMLCMLSSGSSEMKEEEAEEFDLIINKNIMKWRSNHWPIMEQEVNINFEEAEVGTIRGFTIRLKISEKKGLVGPLASATEAQPARFDERRKAERDRDGSNC